MAGKYTIKAKQGATFRRVLTWLGADNEPIDLTGYTARMHVRTHPDDDEFILDLTTENGRIALGGTAGTVTLTVDDATMSDTPAGSYYYDLELVSPGLVVTDLVEGQFNVSREVTR